MVGPIPPGRPPLVPPAKPPLVFVSSLDDPELEPGDHHHLAKVLRVRDGETVTISDGAGRWRPAAFGVRPEATGGIVTATPSLPAITVAFALVKGVKPELVVQKLTELGVDRIVVFVAERSVTRWDRDKAERNLERLGRVAREACMQSRRSDLPVIGGPLGFAEVVDLPGAVLADRTGDAPSLERPTVLIGPEGGWSDAERSRLTGVGSVGLGPNVLRAETAAIVAAAALTMLRSGLAVSP